MFRVGELYKMGILGSMTNKTLSVADLVYGEVSNTISVLISSKSYTDVAMEVTNTIQLEYAALVGLKIILRRCLTGKKKYLAKCETLGSQVYVFISTGGSWGTLALLFWLCRQILVKVE